MRALSVLPLALLLATAGAAQVDSPDAGSADPRTRLTAAKAESARAARAAQDLDRAAAAAGDAARRARLAQTAMAARIRQSESDLAAAEARMVLVRQRVAARQARLAEQQRPVARVLGALQSLASRPPLAAIAQPGSVDDLVHVRAVLGSTIPAIRARTAAARAELDQSRALQRSAALAAKALRDGRARLEANRLAYVRLEADQRLRAQTLGRGALHQSDRALALGEQARDIVGQIAQTQDAAAIEARLATLAGPLPRPNAARTASVAAPAYRLPIAGRVVTGFGEVSDTGVRSRGLTLAAAAGTRVVAPAGGRIVYSGPFRDYGRVVVIDHGAGWTSALIGLGDGAVARGATVAAGDPVGRVGPGDDPRVTVELRRRGRPIEPAALIG